MRPMRPPVRNTGEKRPTGSGSVTESAVTTALQPQYSISEPTTDWTLRPISSVSTNEAESAEGLVVVSR